jgi:hypothetical protein
MPQHLKRQSVASTSKNQSVILEAAATFFLTSLSPNTFRRDEYILVARRRKKRSMLGNELLEGMALPIQKLATAYAAFVLMKYSPRHDHRVLDDDLQEVYKRTGETMRSS